MKYVVMAIIYWFFCRSPASLLADSNEPVVNFESSAKKPAHEKSPRSLFARDPNDSTSVLESEYSPTDNYIDPNDVGTFPGESDVYIDPYDIAPTIVVPPAPVIQRQPDKVERNNTPSAPIQATEPEQLPTEPAGLPSSEKATPKFSSPAYGNDPVKSTLEPVTAPTPDFMEKWQAAWQNWLDDPDDERPDLVGKTLGVQLGFSYVGGFSGSVLGLFGGFVLGNAYQGITGCGQCWLDIAVGGSVLGAGLAASSGAYIFGNNEVQIASWKTTLAGGLLPILFVEGLMKDNKPVSKSLTYMFMMPLTATLAYNLTRRHREPDELDFFELLLYGDSWVSVDPEQEIVALNMLYRF